MVPTLFSRALNGRFLAALRPGTRKAFIGPHLEIRVLPFSLPGRQLRPCPPEPGNLGNVCHLGLLEKLNNGIHGGDHQQLGH